jgi:hypothetical protein
VVGVVAHTTAGQVPLVVLVAVADSFRVLQRMERVAKAMLEATAETCGHVCVRLVAAVVVLVVPALLVTLQTATADLDFQIRSLALRGGTRPVVAAVAGMW